MLPIGSALAGELAHRVSSLPISDPRSDASRPVQPFLILKSSGFFVDTSLLRLPACWITTMASADFPRHFLRGISPGKNAVLPRTAAAFTSTTEPVGFAVLCQLAPSCRPSMRFLFIGSRVSPSLPPHGRSPFRSWLQLVFCLYGSYTGDLNPFWTAPMLGAHKAPDRTRYRAAVS